MKNLLLTLFILLAFSVTAFAGSVALTTYVPSPLGDFALLQLSPRTNPDDISGVCDEGEMFYSSEDHLLYACIREAASGQGRFYSMTPSWVYDETAGGETYVSVDDLTAYVGIGIREPVFQLHIEGDASIASIGAALFNVSAPAPYDFGNDPGSVLYWDPTRGVFRAVVSQNDELRPANIGLASVALGFGNIASGPYSTISGGSSNEAAYITLLGTKYGDTTVGGGRLNKALGRADTIGGGNENTADSFVAVDIGSVPWGATVAGGSENEALASEATVAGGRLNKANSVRSFVGGGRGNEITAGAGAAGAAIAGGTCNRAEGIEATVSGGGNGDPDDCETIKGNRALGDFSTVAGGYSNTAYSKYDFVAGGKSNTAGDISDKSSETHAVVGGGKDNHSHGFGSVVTGGESNTASENWATVGGGIYNTASGLQSIVAGGRSNTASQTVSGILTGDGNTASNSGAAVVSGRSNIASGQWSLAAGDTALASGDISFAAGNNIEANSYLQVALGRYNLLGVGFHPATWDTTEPVLSIGIGSDGSNRANGLTVFKNGSVRAGPHTTSTPPTEAFFVHGPLHVAGDIFYEGNLIPVIVPSDRRLKKNIEPLSGSLERITQLEPVSFEFIDEKYPDGMQEGLIAQDVEKVFPEWVETSENGYKGIRYGLPLQIHLIQSMKELNNKLQEEVDSLKEEINNQRKEIEALKSRFE